MDSTQASVFSFDWTYPVAFIWGLLVLVSFIGWGQAVGFWLLPNRQKSDFGWGLAAAWGMAVFLVLSGPLMMISAFSATFVAFFLAAGLGLAAWCARSLWEERASWTGPANLGLKALFIGLLLLVGLTYAGAVAAHWYNSCDDFAAYFAHTKMLLDMGTLSDPFDFRLMGSLGGQQALSTLILAFFPWKYAHLMDSGIALLMVLGLTQEMVRGGDSKAWIARFILIALALTFSMPRINSASQLTGVVLFMALFRSFDLVSARSSVGWRSALLLGGVVTATATLRCHYVFAAALFGIGFIFWRLWEDKENRRDIIREALMTLGATLVLLAPWWIVSYRSSGIFLFPLVKGTQRPEFDTFSLHLPLPATLQFIGGFFLSTIYLLLFFPVCFLEAGQWRRFLLILGGLLLFISTAFVSQYTYGNYSDLYRYLTPIGLAFGLYSAGAVARHLVTISVPSSSMFTALRAIIAVILAALAIFFQSFGFWDVSCSNVFLIDRAVDARNQLSDYAVPVSTDEAKREYREAFTRIPPGVKVLIAVDYPFLLNYRTHTIYSIDVAGAASPDPGFPYFQGAALVKKYLLAQGIRYIAHVPFDRSGWDFLHDRGHANRDLTGPVPMWHFYATYEIDFFDNIDQLAKSNRILYDSPTVRVIALND